MIKRASPLFLALTAAALFPFEVKSVTPVLDGYAFELFDDVIIDTENNIITINSDLTNCLQPNGAAPLETAFLALYNINDADQFIGLNHISYNTFTGTLYFTSETGNLICDNGVFVDTIFAGGFE